MPGQDSQIKAQFGAKRLRGNLRAIARVVDQKDDVVRSLRLPIKRAQARTDAARFILCCNSDEG